ncbi:GcrA family cell cycle regulator [Mesorhizobium sp.]|uniref:GcrA family cell cycle regulator n=1 Tax=Mesorhizobium sp. TaxID=1871066 RepID=UPI0025DE1436|nr:GcrA family cell cycle regulator [Mesorhizobium sp.]
MRETFLWSGADKDRIAELLVAGLSASKIAAHFAGASRNAVIGVVYRDKRLKAIGLTRRPPPRPKPDDTQKRITVPHTQSRIRLPPTPRKPDQAAPASLEMLLHELDGKQCKWPTNDVPKGGVFLFCGHLRAEQGPYCPYHRSRARVVDSVDR